MYHIFISPSKRLDRLFSSFTHSNVFHLFQAVKLLGSPSNPLINQNPQPTLTMMKISTNKSLLLLGLVDGGSKYVFKNYFHLPIIFWLGPHRPLAERVLAFSTLITHFKNAL